MRRGQRWRDLFTTSFLIDHRVFDTTVPIIVIFTKFDRRVKFARAAIQGRGRKSFTREELEKAKKDGIAQAEVAFKLCCSALRNGLQKEDLHCVYTSCKPCTVFFCHTIASRLRVTVDQVHPGDEHTLDALITNTIEICTKARR